MDAHYHFHSSIGKRTNGPIIASGTVGDEIARGQSAVAAVQYALRGGPYRDKASQVVHTASGNMPLWAHVGSGRRRQAGYAYWSACDKYERANGVLFVAIDIALPDQLPEFSRVAVAIRLVYLRPQRRSTLVIRCRGRSWFTASQMTMVDCTTTRHLTEAGCE